MNNGVLTGFTDTTLVPVSNALQVINSSQTVTALTATLELEIVGGGSGGQPGQVGGPSGGYAFKRYENLTPGVSQLTIVIGAAGLGGASPTAGGQSSVVSSGFTTITCTGGDYTTPVAGTATGGDININGQLGTQANYAGTSSDLNGGVGGSTLMGLGGVGGSPTLPGFPAQGAGAGGGGGGFTTAGSIIRNGGAGAAGRAILRWL